MEGAHTVFMGWFEVNGVLFIYCNKSPQNGNLKQALIISQVLCVRDPVAA